MLLAIDIGNSSIKFGIFDGDEIFHKFSIQTKRDYTVEELLFDRLKLVDQKFIQVDISTCIVASVVPEINGVIAQVCRELFRVTAHFVDEGWNFGMVIDYDPPASAGADRLVNAFAASTKYGKPVIVCSFGTATTIDVVTTKNEFLGGMITAGIAVTSKALQLATAKLPNISIELPSSAIGKNTTDSIRSGVVLGHVEMVDGMIRRFKQELLNGTSLSETPTNIPVVATGGWSHILGPAIPSIDEVDENLTLDGLRILAESGSLQEYLSAA